MGNKTKKLIPVPEVEEKALNYLTHLEEFNDTELFKKILNCIQFKDNFNIIVEQLGKLNPIFECCNKFYEDTGKFPNAELIEIKFPKLFKKSVHPYNPDFGIDLLASLKKVKTKYLIGELLNNGKIKQIQDVISSNYSIEGSNQKLVTVDDMMDLYVSESKDQNLIACGALEIDNLFKGFAYKTLNLAAGGPGCYKTTYAVSLSYNALKCGYNVAYLTLEVSAKNIWFNLLSRHSYEIGINISAESLKKGNLKEYSIPYLNKFFDKIAEENDGIDLLIIDHINLMKFYKIDGIKDEKELLNYYVRYFTNLAITFREKGFVLLILAQVNRESIKYFESSRNKRRGASLASFAESNELERSASTAMIFYADDLMKLEKKVNVYIVKNRDGETREEPIDVYVDPKYYFFGRQDENNKNFDDLLADLGDLDNDFQFV